MQTKKLTGKQDLFCREFIIDLNATQAAIRAGYSKKTAKEIGSENLTKPNIQDCISELRKKTLEQLDISHQRIVEEYAKIAFSDIADYFNDAIRIKEIKEISNTAAIRSITIEERTFDSGTSIKIKITLWNKKEGLEGLAKHTGFFKADNNQKQSTQIIIEGMNAADGVANLQNPDELVG